MMQSNPFTPKSGWEPKTFAGRKEEIKFFKKLITKPDKYKYSLPDKLFREYILRYKGYDGNGSLLRLEA